MILRAGKSARDAGTDDYHRPLRDRGKRGAQRMGAWMERLQLMPDYVISSPAERALVTAQKLCKVVGFDAREIRRDARVYEASEHELLEVLAGCPAGAGRVLLVGHNPGLEALLEWLAGSACEAPGDGRLLPTASLARLVMPDDWQRLGSLHLDIPRAFLGDREVAFYATDAAAVPGLRDSLRDWAEGLPERAHFEFAGGQE